MRADATGGPGVSKRRACLDSEIAGAIVDGTNKK